MKMEDFKNSTACCLETMRGYEGRRWSMQLGHLCLQTDTKVKLTFSDRYCRTLGTIFIVTFQRMALYSWRRTSVDCDTDKREKKDAENMQGRNYNPKFSKVTFLRK